MELTAIKVALECIAKIATDVDETDRLWPTLRPQLSLRLARLSRPKADAGCGEPQIGGVADGFELNKIAGAVLSALLVISGGRVVRDMLWDKPKPEKPGWALPVTQLEPASRAGPAPAPFDPTQVVAMLPQADPDNGRDVFRRCLQCHTAEKDGPHRIGPNLWGVVDRAKAAQPGFPYSEALKSSPGNWTFVDLAKYLHDPKAEIPGTKMMFAGIKDKAELADLLAYLRSLSDSPSPLPD